jgi:ABC-2 type transport system ATP-binding protein
MIEVHNLEKSFGDKDVLNKLTFSIDQGGIYGLLGPNGAGKSTTINILCNLLDADAGKITIKENKVSEKTKYLVGIVPQEISLYKDLTCKENLMFFARLYGLYGSKINERANELIHTFNLNEYVNTQVSKLSGGWQRRVNIAVALIHSPSVLILDEPTAGLDIEARYELWELITEPTAGLDIEARYELWELITNLRDANVTILLTTHQLEEAERLCSRIGIIKNGKIMAEGSLSELRAIVPAKQIAILETSDEKTICQEAASFGWKHRHYGGRLTLLLPEQFSLKDIIEKFDGIPLSSVSLREVSLEHVYMELIGK